MVAPLKKVKHLFKVVECTQMTEGAKDKVVDIHNDGPDMLAASVDLMIEDNRVDIEVGQTYVKYKIKSASGKTKVPELFLHPANAQTGKLKKKGGACKGWYSVK